jgi:hypothetical protein
MLEMISYIIIVNFVSKSDVSMYSVAQKFIPCNMNEGSTWIKIRIHTLRKHEQENTIQKNKIR